MTKINDGASLPAAEGRTMSDAPELKPCPFCGSHDIRPAGATPHHYHRCQNCGCEGPVFSTTPELAVEAWNRRADLVPAPSVTVKAAAKHLLTIWDRWMAGGDAERDAGFRMTQAACFAAQAYEDAASSDMTADSAPGQMLRTLLIGLIDLSSPELDHLRACNRPAPPSEGVEP